MASDPQYPNLPSHTRLFRDRVTKPVGGDFLRKNAKTEYTEGFTEALGVALMHD
jgi:hypothetical protein